MTLADPGPLTWILRLGRSTYLDIKAGHDPGNQYKRLPVLKTRERASIVSSGWG